MAQDENHNYISEILKRFLTKKTYTILTIAIITVILVTGGIFVYNQSLAYSVIVEGDEIGIVSSKREFNSIIKELEEDIGKEIGKEVKLLVDKDYEEIKGFDVESTEKHLIKNKLREILEYKVKAVSFKISDNHIFWLDNKNEAEQLIKGVESYYIDDEKSSLEDVKIQQEISFSEGYVMPDEIIEKDPALEILIRGTDEIREHRVKSGESLWLIARNNNMTVDDLKSANPQLRSETLQINQEINLVVAEPYVNVVTEEKITYNTGIPFTTKVEYDENLWSWEQRVRRHGVYGTKEVTALVIKEDGKEVDRKILNEKVLEEPTQRIVVRGTRSAPSRGTGNFIWPADGRITSPFGRRGRGFHTGVDIAAPIGTPIKAADSGMVTFSGWSGGYGFLVIVDHGNGYETYYAHNSRNLVSQSAKVEKGQVIARVGSTGNSTGPHVHFEIRQKGTPINPLNYFAR